MSDKIINIDSLKYYNDKINQTKQDVLISGQNIKTINGESILGEGDLTVEGDAKVYTWNWDGESESVTLSQEEYDNILGADIIIVNMGGLISCIINSKTGKELNEMLGQCTLMGYFDIQGSKYTLNILINISTKLATVNMEEQEIPTNTSQLENDSNFVSSDGLKTINGESVVGSGNIEISSGNPDANVSAVDTSETLDDVSGVTYVKYVAQTLTEVQKAQARTNIGALSTGDQVTVDLSNYYTKEEIDSQLGDINTILESIINDGTTPTIITFTLGGIEYQAEEGMTFYDWGMSEYYDSDINLVADISDGTFKESCQNYGNTSTECSNKAGILYTPNILLNSVIQPITYTTSTGGMP